METEVAMLLAHNLNQLTEESEGKEGRSGGGTEDPVEMLEEYV